MKLRFACVVIGLLSLVSLTVAQTSTPNTSSLPRLIRFGGTVKDLNGSPQTGVVGITFAFYSEKTGGAPLWLETQNATADSNGHYTVLLGSTKPDGLPAELFTAEEARWVGVQVSGEPEQPRVLLVSAPYALKAGDAETIGGLPPSAFVLAAPAAFGLASSSSTTEALSPAVATDVTTTGGTANYLPIFSGAATIIDSSVFQTGTGTAGKIGINTTTPVTPLDVNGGGTIRGTLSLPATGNATAGGGKNSQGLNLVASSFSSTSGTAQNQIFRWQAEPAANNSTAPTGTLNLQYGLGTATPTETGLKISSKGLFTFAAGQAFPGTGEGSVTSIATGLGLRGGTITKTGTLSIDTIKVPLLAAANTFTANQTVDGTLSATSSTGTAVNGATSAPAYAGVVGSGISIGVYGNGGGGANSNAGNSGIWGDTGGASGNYIAVRGTAVNNIAGGFYNNSTTYPTLLATNSGAGIGVKGVGATGVVGVSTGPAGPGLLPAPATNPGGSFTGYSAPSGSNLDGTYGVEAYGGAGDLSETGMSFAGVGVKGIGGTGSSGDGDGNAGSGGVFAGGTCVNCQELGGGGDGVDAAAGVSGSCDGCTSGYAGYFIGDVDTTGGYLVNGTAELEIDHPLDPANKYLVHASVESSEMMNIYTGNITTDSQGHATVQLPEWFQVLNIDFRYQLTVIGQFAQAIISTEIENNRFEIRTSAPNVKVSWQVTGVRQDPYAKAHPLVVEQEKKARLRGFYTHPELYGAPPEKQIEWSRHPQMMKRIQEMRAKQLATVRAAAQPATAQPK
jgi:hypothetical protein